MTDIMDDSGADKMEDVHEVSTDCDIEEEKGDILKDCEKEQGLSQLHLAAERGDTEVVRRILMSSANVDVLDKKHNTPLHYATLNGHVDVVNLLLSNNANVNSRNDLGRTSLHMAAEIGHLAITQLLLDSNADANIRNHSSGKTSLHIAAEMGYAEIVKALIDNEGEVNALDINGDTALHHAASNGHSAVVNVLLSQTLERDAQIRSQLAVNKVPAGEFQPSQHSSKNKVDVGHTSHLITLKGGNAEIADTVGLLSQSTIVFKSQGTPIHLAVDHGHDKVAKNLIFNGANINACNNAKMTPLHLACQNGHTSIAEILLDNHAAVDTMKQSEKTPFYLVAKNGHADIADVLLRRGVCDFVLTDDRQTPLHVAVKEGHTKFVEVILKHSCRISSKLTKDEQKLQENTKNFIDTRDVKPIQLLKSDGRRVSAGVLWAEKSEPMVIWEDSQGQTALDIAVRSTQPNMVKLLLNADQCTYSDEHLRRCFHCLIYPMGCCDRRDKKETAKLRSDDEQYEMYCKNIKEIAQALISSSKFNINQKNEQPPLHQLTYSFYILSPRKIHISYLIQFLLENGADFNMKNYFGETPLKIASQNGCCHAITLFFDWEEKSGMKLDLDARDRFGATALIKAAEGNHVSAVQMLLNHRPKASANMHDYYGFTALHAAIYQPNYNWFDLYFFCKGLRKEKFTNEEYPQIGQRDKRTCKEEPVDRNTATDQLEKILDSDEKKIQIKEEIVKLLLANEETNVNAIDFRGNTPLDLAVKSSKQVNSATLKALRNPGAIRNLLEPEDDVARVDERRQNPLHRLIIARVLECSVENVKRPKEAQYDERLDLMLHGILLRPENFMESAAATDDKGRTPLHYANRQSCYFEDATHDLVRVLLRLGSDLHAADVYGKTPLHYAETNDEYERLLQYGANENTKDNFGNTPRDLRQLRESVTINEDNPKKLTIGKKTLYQSKEIAPLLNTAHATELAKRKLIETIRIYSQSPRPQESSEEAIWKIWTENEFIRLNRRLSQFKPLVKHFIERLADGIKEKDWRFECQPMLVGSAAEETKAVISADFDFNFKLIKFSQICDPFPHSLGPKGYFQLRRKPNEDIESRSDEKFDSFFNLDDCLLTLEVKPRFKFILEEVLNDPAFWQDEHLFEHLFDWNVIDKNHDASFYTTIDRVCKTIELRMIHPIEDGEGGFLFVNIAIDIVACVHVEGWWSEDPLLVGISPAVKANGSTFVFDGPRFNPSNPRNRYCLFSGTFSRISFAPLESRIIKGSSPLIKAAFIVCKMILYSPSGTTYPLKTCLLYCMEALNARNGSETRNEEEVTPKQLAFWVERIMFCFLEFSRHDVYPCYFMPSFRHRVLELGDARQYLKKWKEDKVDVSSEDLIPFRYSIVYDRYLDPVPS